MDPFTLFLLGLGTSAITGTIGAISGSAQDKKQKEAYQRELERTQDKKTDALNLLDINYQEAEKNALRNADRSDRQSDMAERATTHSANSNINALSLQSIADAYSFNNAAQSAAAGKGNSLAGMAASGTRTSSLGGAVKMADQQAQDTLQLQEDMSRIQSDANLSNTLASLGQNVFQIGMNREDAENLRQSYSHGIYDGIESDGTLLGTIQAALANNALSEAGKSNGYKGAGSEYRKYMLNRDRAEKDYDNSIADLNMAIADLSGGKAVGRWFDRFFTGTAGNMQKSINTVQSIYDVSYNTKANNNFSLKNYNAWSNNQLYKDLNPTAVPTFDSLSQPFAGFSTLNYNIFK